jgi:GTPase
MTSFIKNKNESVIAVCGPVDAGKSSLIGVLTSGELDDGRGKSRNKILKHKHELETGRTSNITFNPLKYKKTKNELLLCGVKDNKILKTIEYKSNENNEKIISFVDLAGHEKYLRTTVYGVTGLFPDYGIVVIGANTGITKLTREHIGILLYLKIPIIIIISKIDMAPKHIYKKLCNRIKKLLSKKTFGKVLYFISENENRNKETKHYIENMIENYDIIPIISVSNKNGINIENLHKLLYEFKSRDKWKEKINGSMVYIDSNFQVPGIGLVLSGTTKGNNIKIKDRMFFGPDNGQFKEVMIRSIHNSIRQNVNEIGGSVQACFAIKFVKQKETIERKQIKKGMVLLDSIEKWKKNIVREFEAKITILQHSTTIKTGYKPMIHCGPIRQTVKLIFSNDEAIRIGDTKIVKFRFEFHSEFLEKNMIFFFRDGNTKGVGEVITLIN